MQIEWTLTIGSIIQVLTIIAAGIVVLIRMGQRDALSGYRLDTLEELVKGQAAELKQIAVALAKLASQDDRLSRVEKGLDEVRHGEGFVLPIKGR